MFNNRIYGLTKGQYSPTSEQHKRTKSTPYGSLDRPFEPIALALGAGATFVARSVDVIGVHLREILKQAAEHRGSAFIEIFQNCNIFNDGAWKAWVERGVRDDRLLLLEHGKPLIYGKEKKRGVVRAQCELNTVELTEGYDESKLLHHDVTREDPAMAFELAHFGEKPENPMPIGVFRNVKYPTFEELTEKQLVEIRAKKGKQSIEELIGAGDTWEVS
jgi:2-oxoglutarate ferredoxin oxidoreductase subunit beta